MDRATIDLDPTEKESRHDNLQSPKMMKGVSISEDSRNTSMAINKIIVIGNQGLPPLFSGKTSSQTQRVPSEEVDANIASV